MPAFLACDTEVTHISFCSQLSALKNVSTDGVCLLTLATANQDGEGQTAPVVSRRAKLPRHPVIKK